MQKIIPIVLSGGIGSRLWPVSRAKRPKPFMWVEDEGSLLQRTFERLTDLNPHAVVSVTKQDYQFAVQHDVSNFHFDHRVILEPFGRNTAGAVGISARYVSEKFGGDTIMVVLPSDHIIKNTDGFIKTIKTAIDVANTGKLCTIGIEPTHPHTGYGYIQSGDAIDGGFNVQKFVEKPDLQTAQSYLKQGGYYWNAGMFVFSADTFLNTLKTHAPDVADVCQKINIQGHDIAIDDTIFAEMPDISIDYAVIEKANTIAVIPAEFDWNDLGSWDSIAQTLPMDENNNHAKGQFYLHNTKNSTVFSTSDEKVIATIGLEDTTVIETRDAVLVAKTDQLQNVKDVVAHFTEQNHDVVNIHRTEYRPWGTFTILDEGENYKTKQILVYPHQQLSLQSHKHRSEHWVCVSGQGTVVNGDDVITLKANQSIYIPQGNKHRLSNDTDAPVIIIEIQTGDYFGEDDIERYTDDYGRE